MKFGTFYVPDSHPTPFLCFLLVLGFFLLGPVFGWSFVVLAGGAAPLPFAASTCNACVTIDAVGGEARDTPPPFRIITTIV